MDYNVCTTCNTGYTLISGPLCVECNLDNCVKCSAENVCGECIKGSLGETIYNLTNGTCIRFCQDTNCKVCTGDHTICTECKTSFFFNNADKCI